MAAGLGKAISALSQLDGHMHEAQSLNSDKKHHNQLSIGISEVNKVMKLCKKTAEKKAGLKAATVKMVIQKAASVANKQAKLVGMDLE